MRTAAPLLLLALLLPAVLAHAQASPDLKVTALSLSPAAPSAGQAVRFTATVTSAGAGSGPFDVSFEVDGTAVDQAHVAGLAAGASATLTSGTWVATQGNHTLVAVVDAGGAVNETNEANNNLTKAFSVGAHQAQPDLIVSSITFDPASPAPGQDVTVTIHLRNTGDADAGAFRVAVTVDGHPMDDIVVGGLRQQAELSYARGPITADAAHTVEALVDSNGTVAESNEFDNTLSAIIAPTQAKADLVISGFTIQPQAPFVGAEVKLTAWVKNTGDATAAASHLQFLDGTGSIGTLAVPSLGAGQTSAALTATWRAASGAHTLRAVADAQHEAAERSEDNNAASLQVTPGAAAPDVAAASLSARPSAPRIGQTATFSVTVRNAGQAAAGPFDVMFSVDGRSIGAVRVPSLDAGRSTALTSAPWTATSGTHTVTVLADSAHVLGEPDEANNLASLTLSAGPATPLSLRVVSVTLDPPDPQPNGSVTFLANVEAQGVPAGERLVVAFALDGDAIGTQQVLPPADGGTFTVRSAPWVASQGRHTASAGVGGPGSEADTQDNVAVVHFAVGDVGNVSSPDETPTSSTSAEPDLVAVSIATADASPVAGTPVPIVVQVGNNGTGAAGPFSVVILVDGQRVGSVDVAGLAAGAATEATFSGWTSSPGAHTFQAMVDPVDAVRESDESNNQVSLAPDAASQHPKPLPGFEPVLLLVLLGLAALRRR